jgi:hypothetical protein
MTLQTFSTVPTISNTTAFRVWGLAWSTALQAADALQKTSDTGQVDWSTVTAPVSTNAAAGYEIYRFKDSLQSTAPIFLKIEFGSGSTASTASEIWVTVGTGSDGAGTITGTFFAGAPPSTAVIANRIAIFGNAGMQSASSTASYINGDSATLAIFAYPVQTGVSTSTGALFVLERTRDFAGSPTGEGYLALSSTSFGGSSTGTMCPASYISNGYTTSGSYTTIRAWHAGNSGTFPTTLLVGGNLQAQPVHTGFNTKLHGPSQFVLGLIGSEITGGLQFAVTHYGTSRNFLTAGVGDTTAKWGTWMGPCNSFMYRMN